MKEPKSLVLPLHHNSIYILHINSIYIRQRYYQRRRPSTPTKAMLQSFCVYNHENYMSYKALVGGVEERFAIFIFIMINFLLYI